MRNLFAGALASLALTATLAGAANAESLNSKPQPAMTAAFYEQTAAAPMVDHANANRPGAGSGARVVGNVEHGPTVRGEQTDQNMYDPGK